MSLLDRFGNYDPPAPLLDELDELRDLRSLRSESVYMEERVTLGVQIDRLERKLGAAIGRGDR
jgi:hypothetical protein